jgi:hypothetical protein
VSLHQKLSNAAPCARDARARHPSAPTVVGNSSGRIMIIRGINTSGPVAPFSLFTGISLPLARFSAPGPAHKMLPWLPCLHPPRRQCKNGFNGFTYKRAWEAGLDPLPLAAPNFGPY